MLLAAGRGERMRPLTDVTPKPLLPVGGKPLIQWNVERLVEAGFRDIVINHAYLGSQIEAVLGDGSKFGARLLYSPEVEALETAGGVANALPLLGEGPTLVVSADIYTDFDFRSLAPRLAQMAEPENAVLAHLVMTPNPDHHPLGDFVLEKGRLRMDGAPRLNFGNIGIYHPRLFDTVPRGAKAGLGKLFREAIAQDRVTGERYDGFWVNVGTPAQLTWLDEFLKRKAG